MSVLYFSLLLVMAVLAFALARGRASSGARAAAFHSRPNYHGLLAASLVAIPMLVVFVIGAILTKMIAESQALTALDPALLTDPLRRGAALREIVEVANGRFRGNPSITLQAAGDTWAYVQRVARFSIYGLGLAAGIGGLMFALRSITPDLKARNRFEWLVTVLQIGRASCRERG